MLEIMKCNKCWTKSLQDPKKIVPCRFVIQSYFGERTLINEECCSTSFSFVVKQNQFSQEEIAKLKDFLKQNSEDIESLQNDFLVAFQNLASILCRFVEANREILSGLEK